MYIVWGILAGLVGGVCAGMGMGGGTLLIPILTIFLSYSQIDAQGINLIAFLPMSAVALYLHHKNNLVEFKETWPLAVSGAVVSFLSAMLANSINSTVLKKIFAVFLLGVGVWQLIEGIKQQKNKKTK